MTLTFLEVVYCVTFAIKYLGLEIEAWFQRTTNRKRPMGTRMVT